ncbi:MAG: serine--tRNA ligase [Candidatus Pacebacteria bacterium]|nr:serine--tRNA ligase [Candidatus Paceibacterota bacterium]
MLDIKFIRENRELVKEAARKKRINFNVDRLLELDEARRKLLQETETMKAEQNIRSERVSKITDESEKQKLISELKILKDKFAAGEKNLNDLTEKWQNLMFEAPNIPDLSVPEGESDLDNKEIRRWGKIPFFDFTPKNHLEILKTFDLADFERGSKVSGFRGYFLKNEGALLDFAIWQFVFDEMVQNGFVPFLAPSLVKEESFLGTGWLPQGKDEVYQTQDNLYLAGTAEVPMMGYHAGEILIEEELPKKYVALSPCFRREAGSYGKDVKGLYRVHEFMKVEQIVLCKADHQESVKWHEEITQNSERIMQKLGIPYRVVVNCGADLGLGQVKKYDIEGWVASEKKYRETHSASYFHDFQTRRLNMRYRSKDGKIYFVHSLNNTVIATPRILISILENNQQKDGSIIIPEPLRKYMGKDRIFR